MTTPTLLPLSGELTIYRATELRQTLLAALAEPMTDPDGLALDLSGVTELDSAGLQLLLSARLSASTAGRSLDFLNPSPAVVHVWQMLGLPTPDHPHTLGSVHYPARPSDPPQEPAP